MLKCDPQPNDDTGGRGQGRARFSRQSGPSLSGAFDPGVPLIHTCTAPSEKQPCVACIVLGRAKAAASWGERACVRALQISADLRAAAWIPQNEKVGANRGRREQKATDFVLAPYGEIRFAFRQALPEISVLKVRPDWVPGAPPPPPRKAFSAAGQGLFPQGKGQSRKLSKSPREVPRRRGQRRRGLLPREGQQSPRYCLSSSVQRLGLLSDASTLPPPFPS